MTAAIWTLFAVLLSIWTGVVWLATELTRWTSQALEEGTRVGAADLPAVIGPMPDWLAAWLPADVLPAVLAGVQWATQLLETSLPWAGAAVGWLVAVAWVGWFLVALVLTIAAFMLHVIVRRSSVHVMPRGL
jgi:hypothetical protein